MKTVELWCEGGQHTWEREVKRGRKPTSCPQHSDVEVQAKAAQAKFLEPVEEQAELGGGTYGEYGEIRISNVERTGDGAWRANATLNGVTRVFHDRAGSWFADHPTRKGVYQEPLRDIAFALEACVRKLERRERRVEREAEDA